MTKLETHLYPNPSQETCERCVYRKPCIAMNEGCDPSALLENFYRKKGEKAFRQGRPARPGRSIGELRRRGRDPSAGKRASSV